MKKPFKNTKIGKFLLESTVGKILTNTAQNIPVVGTITTALVEETENSPKGEIKLTKWHWYRIGVGLLIGTLMYFGIDIVAIAEKVAHVMYLLGI